MHALFILLISYNPHQGEPRYLGPFAWAILIILFSVVWWKLKKSGYKKGVKKNNEEK